MFAALKKHWLIWMVRKHLSAGLPIPLDLYARCMVAGIKPLETYER